MVVAYLRAELVLYYTGVRKVFGRSDIPPNYIVVSDNGPPHGASADVLINFRVPSVSDYDSRIRKVFDLASPSLRGVVINVAASRLVHPNELVVTPPNELCRRPMPMQPIFRGHYECELLPTNIFAKPKEILELESVGISFEHMNE
eukprot:TRINITY_DN58030_c0_g1_i1.p1 TRINITY_DN58030_c0_g1~~TRINITY_DN58030_c0_g1_i1.p1  ORF type:complete len:146 (-),score=21.61 TRINITY_DN58030_c0_g1_i1:68-505(-)